MARTEKKEIKREFSLDGGGWEIGRVFPGAGMEEIETWYPAEVPGNIQNDLIAADVIQDPYYGLQNEPSRWVETHDWWYRKKFRFPKSSGNRAILVLKGVDYESDIYFNGRRVASHTGMFSPIVVDVTKRLLPENTICVRIVNTGSLKDRVKTLKCQMSFGWDFAPPILTMGIWNNAYIVRPRDVYIKELTADALPGPDGSWEVNAGIDLDDSASGEAEIDIEITAANFAAKDKTVKKHLVVLHKGLNGLNASLTIDKPQLWDIWEEGKQNLYSMKVTVLRGGKVLDTAQTRFGLRTVQLLKNSGSDDHLWTFEINGREQFIRGANWVPADSMPGRLDEDRYRPLLQMARDANINMLRVWGGGLGEKQEFYDICDEFGILVWQEFPFACPLKPYPVSKSFYQLVTQEATAITLACRNHPSVVMFCGGNEFSRNMNKRLIHDLEKVVESCGGGRPFKPTSPTAGEHHRYIVFHMLGNIAEYLEEDCAFFSEFGLQSIPDRESLEKFIPQENLWPIKPVFPYNVAEFISPRPENFEFLNNLMPDSRTSRNVKVWAYHNAHLMKITRYANEIGYEDLNSFIEASQKMQAFGLQVAIEHIRRRRMASSGVMFWQYNEPWPAISWSVVDYYLKPKLAYHKLKEIYNPLFISLEFPLKKYKPGDAFEAKPFLINDTHKAFKDLTLKIRMIGDGKIASETRIAAGEAEPDSIRELALFKTDVAGDRTRVLECVLERSGKTLCRNSYDLTIHDSAPTPKLLKLGFRMMEDIFWK